MRWHTRRAVGRDQRRRVAALVAGVALPWLVVAASGLLAAARAWLVQLGVERVAAAIDARAI